MLKGVILSKIDSRNGAMKWEYFVTPYSKVQYDVSEGVRLFHYDVWTCGKGSDSFTMTCGEGKDSFTMTCGKGIEFHYYVWEGNR